MEFSDTVEVGAPPERVWSLLSDPHALAVCVPGVGKVEILEPVNAQSLGAFGGAATLQLGSTQLRVPVRVEWREQDPPQGGRLRAVIEVNNIVVQVDGTVALQAVTGSSTEIVWRAQVAVPEPLASNPMLVSIGQTMAVRFIKTVLECLREQLESGAES